MPWWASTVMFLVLIILLIAFLWTLYLTKKRKTERYNRTLRMVPMLIHLPPATDDVEIGSRDERDVANEALSQAQVMYSILSSTYEKSHKASVFGQRHLAFEIVAKDGAVKYYVISPLNLVETVKQAVHSAYPTALIEIADEENIFSSIGKSGGVSGGELSLKKDYVYPINTYEETKRDPSRAILDAMSTTKGDEGLAIQILVRPAGDSWVTKSKEAVQKIKDGQKTTTGGSNALDHATSFVADMSRALWEPPKVHENNEHEEIKPLTALQNDEIATIENKTKYPGFETLIRIIASSTSQTRSEAMAGGVVSAFSQFDSPANNGFRYGNLKSTKKLAADYIFYTFPRKSRNCILNSMELASIFHLPAQNAIPTSQVERQTMKQIDGPSKLATEGLLLGVNEFRGQQKEIRLSEKDRRRHTYVIGATGMGKSVLLGNLAYQDMMDGRGFAFIDPHGDVVEDILSKVPEERIDDVIYFDPGDMDNPIGMNMFEFDSPDQKDFIIQEGINMLYSLYDPGHTGIFGPRGEHMFRNAALLLMSDPNGATFIDIPRVFIDPDFVREKLKYVTDKTVYDYWTKEFPASQKSSDAGEVTTWFVSKWGPFLSNTMMRNILGQTKSGFQLRDIMDNKKILLVNLSKGKMGELNSKLLGMIFVMKFQTAAMSRVDTPEEERNDFCLFVDEFQNFSTESFESILSEARKFRLNLIVANQFITQLSDKIREGILGNVGTFIAGRLGVTDAELLEKVFAPVFNAEDLHKLPNYHAISTVMMFGVPSSPFTMSLLPPMGKKNEAALTSLKAYSAAKYGRPRAQVDAEIDKRLASVKKPEPKPEPAPEAPTTRPQNSFLDTWKQKKASIEAEARKAPTEPPKSPEKPKIKPEPEPKPEKVEEKAEEPESTPEKEPDEIILKLR